MTKLSYKIVTTFETVVCNILNVECRDQDKPDWSQNIEPLDTPLH